MNKLKFYKNGSKLISRAQQGKLSSKLWITSGCKTPTVPITLPFTWIAAHLPGIYVGSC